MRIGGISPTYICMTHQPHRTLDTEYVWSDLHFYHKNVIAMCDRPFVDVDEMNTYMVDTINNTVPEGGTLWVLGDIIFSGVTKADELLSRINVPMNLIIGNHDVGLIKKEPFSKHFQMIRDYYYLRIKEDDINHQFAMSHYPMLSWDQSHRGSYMLHGHTHGMIKTYPFDEPARIIDVGIDSMGLAPKSLREIVSLLEDNTFPPRWGGVGGSKYE